VIIKIKKLKKELMQRTDRTEKCSKTIPRDSGMEVAVKKWKGGGEEEKNKRWRKTAEGRVRSTSTGRLLPAFQLGLYANTAGGQKSVGEGEGGGERI